MSIDHLKIPVDRLAPACDPDSLGFETTAEIEPLSGTIGQDRAVSALELGLEIEAPGFNIFVSGVPGTGRNPTLRSHLEEIASRRPNPRDWGYVYNFQEPTQPTPMDVPCGMLRGLVRDMVQLVHTCRTQIPAAFGSDDYTHRVEEVMGDIQKERMGIGEEIESQARSKGFAISSTQVEMTPVPLHPQGHPLTQEEFGQLTEAERDQLRETAEELQHAIVHVMSDYQKLNKQAEERTLEMDVELVRFTLKPIIDDLQEKYSTHANIVTYLDEVEADMVAHTHVFKPPEGQPQIRTGGLPEEDFFARYEVNDLIDNTFCSGAPVEFEQNPTYYNLFGRIDYRARMGALSTDHTLIKPGAIHRANGGYLVVQAKDLLASALSWDTLKRVLRSGEVRVENIGEQYTPVPTTSMRPLPIPVSAKVILVGGPSILRVLQSADEDFRRYFKVTAEFDTAMERTPENISRCAEFVASEVRQNNLRPVDNTGVAAVVDYSSRLVEDQTKLTARLRNVSDILIEADYWAGKSGAETVARNHVRTALEQREYRAGLTEERLQESIEKDTIRIATSGAVVGQLNGLAVYSLGEHSFGKPSRITARVSVGSGRVVNIDRETRLSGRIHNKGFLILNGYLQGKYGQDGPLSMSASLTFEQTYTEIDGDSASSAELYALLSELSGLPIYQGIAVTGSVNQAGEVQAIGGSTYKIEGFFEVCKARGLTGSQGVMVPKDNIPNLTLRPEVVDAVSDGQFHVYAVSTIDEGIEVLTGTEAGQPGEDGEYPEGSVHFLVEERLQEMSRRSRQAGRPPRDSESSSSESNEAADEG